jgi:hypothetical protein
MPVAVVAAAGRLIATLGGERAAAVQHGLIARMHDLADAPACLVAVRGCVIEIITPTGSCRKLHFWHVDEPAQHLAWCKDTNR